MAAKKNNKIRPPLTIEEAAINRRTQGQERARRGFVSFTRTEVREAVLGETAGENALQQVHRRSQIKRR